MKKNLVLLAAALLLTIFAVPTNLLADQPQPPCPTCKGPGPFVPPMPPAGN